jgi:hypothetical protein
VGLDFGFGLFSGIKNSITAIVVVELFIPGKERSTCTKGGSRFLVSTQSLDNRKREKEKILFTREWRNEEERT